jgi:hypothetical protein
VIEVVLNRQKEKNRTFRNHVSLAANMNGLSAVNMCMSKPGLNDLPILEMGEVNGTTSPKPLR